MQILRKQAFVQCCINCKLYALFLLWGISLLFGISFAYAISHSSESVLYTAISQPIKPLPALFLLAFPVAVCTVSLRYSVFAICYPLVVLNGLSYGFCGMTVYYAFGTATWLCRFLFLFSGVFSSVCMWMLFLRHSRGKGASFFSDVYFAFIAMCIVLIVDIYFVSPFLADLTKYL